MNTSTLANTMMEGRCLCGAVTLTTAASACVDACHCATCRRWSGGPLLAIQCAQVDISGRDHVGVFRSSDWAERGFCKTCGTHLFYRLIAADSYALPAGLFQDQPDLELEEQIFIESKPDYYEFANATPKLTGAEVFAKFAAQESGA